MRIEIKKIYDYMKSKNYNYYFTKNTLKNVIYKVYGNEISNDLLNQFVNNPDNQTYLKQSSLNVFYWSENIKVYENYETNIRLNKLEKGLNELEISSTVTFQDIIKVIREQNTQKQMINNNYDKLNTKIENVQKLAKEKNKYEKLSYYANFGIFAFVVLYVILYVILSILELFIK